VELVSAFEPWPKVMVPAEPFVQVTLTLPLPLRAVEALAETGSYAPKATALVESVQLALTVADTLRLLGRL